MVALEATDRQAKVESARPAVLDRATKLGALVLARQVGQSIVIGGSVRVEVVSLKAGTVRLRFVAPRSIAVHRREVYDAIRLARGADRAEDCQDPAGELAADPGAMPLDKGLVLSRRVGETTMIGSSIAVEVVEARPGVARLRVVAPRSVAVHRHEVADQIRAAGW